LWVEDQISGAVEVLRRVFPKGKHDASSAEGRTGQEILQERRPVQEEAQPEECPGGSDEASS
tara:strand:- start:264 stop:449 length:186 start_codon:yes stop_codon:yes gene_type:complete